jgi:uncharacterized Zn finger protein (UPF0148 family)
MPPHCPKCDTVNRDAAVFCDTCGTRLEVPEEHTKEKERGDSELRDEENYVETVPRPDGE